LVVIVRTDRQKQAGETKRIPSASTLLSNLEFEPAVARTAGVGHADGGPRELAVAIGSDADRSWAMATWMRALGAGGVVNAAMAPDTQA